jgi:dienelactone hydrolase
LLLLAVLGAGLVAAGCSPYVDPNVPEPIRPFIEPGSARPYLLYRPSSYDPDRAWPLIVVCHGSFPDSPNRQIRSWTELAESHGFLVLAPEIKAPRKKWPAKVAEEAARQRANEDHVLAALQHVRGAHNISEERVFIYGWSDGAHTALHTGLRHADLFRAVSVARPRFDEGYLADILGRVDHHQPVYVDYSIGDAVTGKHGRQCAEWLRTIGVNVREDSAGPVRRTDCERTVQFYEKVIRTEPWIYIRAFPDAASGPRQIQFKLRCSFTPVRYHWEFGDGDESPVAEPVHVYSQPDTYRVAVTVTGPDGDAHQRTLDLSVP